MKKLWMVLTTLVVTIFFAGSVLEGAEQTKVRGHIRKNGRYVHSHSKTKKNKSKADNWSRKGNINPNTGKQGTRKY